MDNDTLYFDVQQKTDKQHILDNPDTYIGSVENIDSNMWIMNETGDKIIEQNINYVPGLFKLFDEGIVNCRDHVIRMQSKIKENVANSLPVSYIDVAISDDGIITMINDGNGMDVAQHPETKIWMPELIFGHLRTSTNYNKEEKKIVGGKNGFGFKLVLIWSSYGYIETVDHIRGLKYTQEFKNNLDIICEPKITKASKSKPYTKIVFKPDYQRFGIDNLTPEMIALLKKRVYDISAVTDKTIKVKYNSCVIPTKNFEQYINLYIGDKSMAQRVYEEYSERWEYAIALSPSKEFVQISFVNGIYTSKGGKHVDYILGQITKKITEHIEKKKKIKVNPSAIKEQIMLFLRCDIENPAFDSQTKDYMNTLVSKFGSKCEVSDKFIEKVIKMGVMDTALKLTEVKDNKEAKKTDGNKTKKIKGMPKLDDANFAGTAKSKDCVLILCEGDSAKTGVISGLKSSDRDYIGVYPLKGKVMNVRGETAKKIATNEEIAGIKKILGLETGKEYKTIEDINKYLRYGKIILTTDQDLDGSHIKGLCINLFQNEWPSLTHIPGFISFMNTPILKARKGKQELKFYNDGEYENWKIANNDGKGWTIKYYKGLGTSTKIEWCEYFEEKKYVGFEHNGEPSDDSIDMVFNKKRADDRKTWLEAYDRKCFVDTNKTTISYEDFVNKELIHFSKYDCDRSIPNLMDGLKISLRKILYSAFKRRLTTEAKVSQLSGYVSEHSGYHHGEDSLNKAIVGMGQNFVGSNNINLLKPCGQFGSRILGGSDSASPRYIFTKLEEITRYIFPEQDDAILNYLNDDGLIVEPQFYAPIIPMVLINGTKGIGTGFSTDILCYNIKDIIEYLKNKLTNNDELNNMIEFIPYYEDFTGTINKIDGENKYIIKGKYEVIDNNTIRVTELPIGFWTEDFKELIGKLEDDKDKDGNKITPIIKDKNENYTDNTISFEITFSEGKLNELINSKGDFGCNGLEKVLKLYTTKTTSNMHLFDEDDKLKKYDSVTEIIDDYFDVRLSMYQDRKDYLVDALEQELLVLSNKVKYIKEVLSGTIDLREMEDKAVDDMLILKDFDTVNDSFNYLITMSMNSVTKKNVEKLMNEEKEKQVELETIQSTTIQQMWLKELNALQEKHIEYLKYRKISQTGKDSEQKKSIVKTGKKSIVKKSAI